jgi:hypothetical protein
MNKETERLKQIAQCNIDSVSHCLFKEDELIIDRYKDVYIVLICNEIDFLCRRLSDNKVDSLTPSHFKIYEEVNCA